MRIINNLPALKAFKSLNATNKSLNKTINALSTGLRINSASDDAAGFAISEKMHSQISGLETALRNSQDGISLLQTAEGALGETNSMLQRMRELAVQASNDSLTSNDRQYIQLEIDELRDQINRIANTTQFNKKRLLDGSSGALYSSSGLNVKARINCGLIYIDSFGQKVSSEGNYRIEVQTEAGEAQVQKSNIMRISKISTEITEPELETININTGTNGAGETSGNGWSFSDGVLTITGNGIFKIEGTGEVTKNHVKVNSGTDTIIVLSNTNIDVQGNYNTCAFDMTGAKVDMYLEGSNSLKSGQGRAGLEVPDGAEIKISSTKGDGSTEGSLEAYSSFEGAGIGGPGLSYSPDKGRAGTITIYGGSIKAIGDYGCAGIGAGDTDGPDGGGNITINGGTVFAYGGYGAAGIGSSFGTFDTHTNITITGGIITAEGGTYAAGIGGGWQSNPGHVRIGPQAVIHASGGLEADDIGGGVDWDDADVEYLDIYPPEPRELTWQKINITEKENSFTLSEISTFYDPNGVFLVSQPQTITITQGNGQSASITLYETDTMQDVAKKINDAIANSLGQSAYTDNTNKFCTLSDGTENTSESVYDKVPIYSDELYKRNDNGDLVLDENGNRITLSLEERLEGYEIYSTMLIRSVIPGKAGELYFSGDEDLLNALGLNTIQSSSESTYTASVYDAHSGNTIAENVKAGDSEFISLIPPDIDIRVDSMAGLQAAWDEGTKRFMLAKGDTYTAIIHLKDNSTIFQTGANNGEDFIIQLGDTSSYALGIDSVNLLTREAASRSISILDRAINRVSSHRAKIGAYQNALEHTMENLTTTSLNLTAAESRIRDADMSQSMMEFVKLQILNQSGTSMLAQANQLPQSVLSLLQ